MARTRKTSRWPFARCASYSDSQWEMVKHMMLHDSYPAEAGTYRIEFVDTYTRTADRAMEMFMKTMNDTRKDFTILGTNMEPGYISILYSHKGYRDDLFIE